jgi:hypothetical protein
MNTVRRSLANIAVTSGTPCLRFPGGLLVNLTKSVHWNPTGTSQEDAFKLAKDDARSTTCQQIGQLIPEISTLMGDPEIARTVVVRNFIKGDHCTATEKATVQGGAYA